MTQILDTISPEEFNRLAAHPMQSYEWGQMRAQTGVRVVRFGEYKNDELACVYQMTVHKLPKLSLFIGYVPRSLVPSQETADYIRAWAKKEKIIFIKWEPYVTAIEGKDRILALRGMRVSSHPLFTEWNQEVDLSLDEEAMFAACSKNTRYSVRHAEKAGVEVKEMSTDEGFRIFSELYFSTVTRQKYHGHGKRFHELLWKALSPSKTARIFVAYYNGTPRAAFEIFFWHDRAYYPYSGSADTDRNIPATQLLMWRVMQEARKEGMKTLDLWGSLPPEHSKTHAWRGFTLFKKGFGSRFVQMTPSTDQVISPTLYALYSVAVYLRKLIWNSKVL